MAKKYKIGWFSTAKGKGSRGLLKAAHDSIANGEINAEIDFVFCSREPGESEQTDIFLKQVEEYRIPLVCFSYQKFKKSKGISPSNQTDTLPTWRLEYDREVMSRLKGFNPALCILAGYMLVVGKEMCRKYDMINLHPAAPGGPAGTWQEVNWQLIEAKAEQTGAMMHLVTPELDKGPVVAYYTFSIRGVPFNKCWREIEGRSAEDIKQTEGENNALFKLIREYGVVRELPLVISTIKAFSEGRIRVTPDKKVVDSKGKLIKGYNLTEEINERIKKEF